MRQTELHLNDEDRELIESYRVKGLRHAREVNRAHILSALDRGIPEARIMAVLGVGRTVIWRTRAAYLEGGAEYALHDVARSGKARQYGTDVEAQISALACCGRRGASGRGAEGRCDGLSGNATRLFAPAFARTARAAGQCAAWFHQPPPSA